MMIVDTFETERSLKQSCSDPTVIAMHTSNALTTLSSILWEFVLPVIQHQLILRHFRVEVFLAVLRFVNKLLSSLIIIIKRRFMHTCSDTGSSDIIMFSISMILEVSLISLVRRTIYDARHNNQATLKHKDKL